MQQIAGRSNKLKQRLINILNDNIASSDNSPIGEIMIRNTDKSVKDAIELINCVLKGLNDKI